MSRYCRDVAYWPENLKKILTIFETILGIFASDENYFRSCDWVSVEPTTFQLRVIQQTTALAAYKRMCCSQLLRIHNSISEARFDR